MTDLQKLLTEIQRLSNEATPAPWHALPGVNTQSGWFEGQVYAENDGENVTAEVSGKDAEFIALARTALPQLASILQAVIYDCESIIEAIDQKKIKHPARRGIKVQAGTTLQVISENLGGNECELNH